jgi:hypothetical protein
MEQRLLDELDDARESYTYWRRIVTWSVVAVTGGLLVLVGLPVLLGSLHSLGIDWGPGVGWASLAGIPITVLGCIAGGLALFDELPDRRRELRRAERRYRDAVMS